MRYLAFMLMLAAIGCSRSATGKKDPGLFTGMWIQTAYLADPGDGSGTWQTDLKAPTM